MNSTEVSRAIFTCLGKVFYPSEGGCASGFIASEDGLFVTCYHAIEGRAQIRVLLFDPTRNLAAFPLVADDETDLTILKLEKGGLPYLQIDPEPSIRAGEEVLVGGFPSSEKPSFQSR